MLDFFPICDEIWIEMNFPDRSEIKEINCLHRKISSKVNGFSLYYFNLWGMPCYTHKFEKMVHTCTLYSSGVKYAKSVRARPFFERITILPILSILSGQWISTKTFSWWSHHLWMNKTILKVFWLKIMRLRKFAISDIPFFLNFCWNSKTLSKHQSKMWKLWPIQRFLTDEIDFDEEKPKSKLTEIFQCNFCNFSSKKFSPKFIDIRKYVQLALLFAPGCLCAQAQRWDKFKNLAKFWAYHSDFLNYSLIKPFEIKNWCLEITTLVSILDFRWIFALQNHCEAAVYVAYEPI